MISDLLPFAAHACVTVGLAFACVATDPDARRMSTLVCDGRALPGSRIVKIGRWSNGRVCLLNHTALPVGHGLYFGRTAAVHMRGMLIAIDIVFLDDRGRVVGLVESAAPGEGRIRGPKGARATLELGRGTIKAAGLAFGQTVALA
jgi:uncharacterized membrane protein (UPF0127 family)